MQKIRKNLILLIRYLWIFDFNIQLYKLYIKLNNNNISEKKLKNTEYATIFFVFVNVAKIKIYIVIYFEVVSIFF